MNTRRTNAENGTKPETGESGSRRRPRRPARPKGDPVELSPETLKEAVRQLLSLAVEYEQLHQPIAGPGPDASDRRVRKAMQEMSHADQALHDIIEVISRYHKDRKDLVAQLKTAGVVWLLADFITEERRKWEAEQRRREAEKLPVQALKDNVAFKQKLSAHVKEIFAFWQLKLPEGLDSKIHNVAVTFNVRGGLQGRLAAVVGHRVSTAKGRTIEGYIGALKGKSQTQGRITESEDARLGLHDEPMLPSSDVLPYVLHLLAAGRPESVIQEILKMWDAALPPVGTSSAGEAEGSSDRSSNT